MQLSSEDALFHAVQFLDTIGRIIMSEHLSLVVRIAQSYRSSDVPLDTRVHEGIEALMIAARYYQPRHDGPFAAYAIPWIRDAIRRCVRSRSSHPNGSHRPSLD